MTNRADALTAILNQLNPADATDSGVARVLPFVYDELRGLADELLRGERNNHTLQATALVHEAYMRLAGSDGRQWQDRYHFFRLAAKTMRHILVDHARARGAQKRGGGSSSRLLTDTSMLTDRQYGEILEIDDALGQLFALAPQKAQIVEMRFYGGCTIDETADALGISTATVERDWRFARAWLKAKLSGNEQPIADRL
jgi:RNA polymerase sigma factor (TIGR02999 family)